MTSAPWIVDSTRDDGFAVSAAPGRDAATPRRPPRPSHGRRHGAQPQPARRRPGHATPARSPHGSVRAGPADQSRRRHGGDPTRCWQPQCSPCRHASEPLARPCFSAATHVYELPSSLHRVLVLTSSAQSPPTPRSNSRCNSRGLRSSSSNRRRDKLWQLSNTACPWECQWVASASNSTPPP